MCNPACLEAEYGLFYISENSSPRSYGLKPDSCAWSDDEIEKIRTVLRKLTASRVLNTTDVEDLVQDTLLTMLAKHPGEDLEKGMLVWSLGILRKKVGNYYRKTQRTASLDGYGEHPPLRIRESTAGASPEMRVLHEELQGIVGETLALLPPSQRQAMELQIAGLDTREIVERLHPERYQNVINWLFRARQKMAKELAKYGYGPGAKIGMRRLKRCRGRRQMRLRT